MSNILLIEADQWIATNVCRLFQKSGHQVIWYVNLQTAIDSADASRPDLIILDLLLAGRSGAEFLYEFRSYPDWLNLPIVLFSNISEEELGSSLAGFNQLNISAYHYKPTTSLSQLAQTVERLFLPAHL